MRTRMTATRLALALCLASVGFAGPAWAQNTGAIEGTIADASGALLPGVTVVLKNTETGVERTTTSDQEGRYRFAALPPASSSLGRNCRISPPRSGRTSCSRSACRSGRTSS